MIKVNEYEGGRVKSLGFELDGLPYTAGVVEPGEYTFGTEKEEHLTVTAGRIEFRLPGQDWVALKVGDRIIIPRGIKFDLKAAGAASYICAYK